MDNLGGIGLQFSKALNIKTSATICTAAPNQLALANSLREGYYVRHLRRLRAALQKQMESFLLSLKRHFPEQTRDGFPEGGAAIWNPLMPQGIEQLGALAREMSGR